MLTTPFQTFEEAAENLLSLVNSIVSGKTIFLSKITDQHLEMVSIIDNNTGLNLPNSISLLDTY